MPAPNCPFCKARSLERIRRGPVMKNIFGWLPLRLYRCGKCMKKIYRRTPSIQSGA